MTFANLKIKFLDTGREIISKKYKLDSLNDFMKDVCTSKHYSTVDFYLESGETIFIPIDYLLTQCIVEIVPFEKKFEEDWMHEVYKVANSPGQANGKISAIKLYRKMTGLGIKEAKDWVEENCC